MHYGSFNTDKHSESKDYNIAKTTQTTNTPRRNQTHINTTIKSKDNKTTHTTIEDYTHNTLNNKAK